MSNGREIPVSPPAAYVILNRALKPIIADSVDTLQDRTLDSTAPPLNTVVATEGWLRRFDVSDDQLNAYSVELHKTPKSITMRSGIGASVVRTKHAFGELTADLPAVMHDN